MTSDVPTPLPQFDVPPVIEVALGVEFLSLPGLTAVPMVEMRALWRDQYPLIEEQPALPPSRPMGANFGLEIGSGVPPVRIWFMTEDRTELLQLQSDRLVLNWRKTDPFNQYPRYRRLAPRFIESWLKFESAVREHSLGELRPILAEVTYVNHIHLKQHETLFDVLAFFRGRPPFEAAEAELRLARPLFDVEPDSQRFQYGHQVVTAGRVQGVKTNEVHLTVATRIEIAGIDAVSIQEALERGHIVGARTFADLTKPRMHDRWGRTE